MNKYIANIGHNSNAVVITGSSPQNALLRYIIKHYKMDRKEIGINKYNNLDMVAHKVGEVSNKYPYCTAIVVSDSTFNYYIVRFMKQDCNRRIQQYLRCLKNHKIIDDFNGDTGEWRMTIKTPYGDTYVLIWINSDGGMCGEIQRFGQDVEYFKGFTIYNEESFTGFLCSKGVIKYKAFRN